MHFVATSANGNSTDARTLKPKELIMARPPKVTQKRVDDAIAQGYGQGHGEKYKPFMQIKRWNPSPVSTQVRKAVPPFARACHFFSLSEWLLAILFSWIGALVREQYPAWPMRHPHPCYGLNPDTDSRLPWSPGMAEICRRIGISHGNFVGTNVLYVWTIDLMLTIPWARVGPGACMVSIKPIESERYLYIDPLDRGPEKLEAERRYASDLGIPYFIGDQTLYPRVLLGQLEWLANAASLPTTDPRRTLLQRFLQAHGPESQNYPLEETAIRLQKDLRLKTADADYLLQHCLWHQYIDVDISKRIDFRRCPAPGGRALRAAIRESLCRDEK
jgi:hypothetical protein